MTATKLSRAQREILLRLAAGLRPSPYEALPDVEVRAGVTVSGNARARWPLPAREKRAEDMRRRRSRSASVSRSIHRLIVRGLVYRPWKWGLALTDLGRQIAETVSESAACVPLANRFREEAAEQRAFFDQFAQGDHEQVAQE